MQDKAFDPKVMGRNMEAISEYAHKKFNIKSNDLKSVAQQTPFVFDKLIKHVKSGDDYSTINMLAQKYNLC